MTQPTRHHRILQAANLNALADRSGYGKIMFFCLLQIPIIIILFGIVFYLRTDNTYAPNYAVHQGQAYPMHTLHQPNLNSRAVLNWSIEAATACYTFDFFNYPQVMENVRTYFTPEGYDTFMAALQQAKVIETISGKKLVVSAVPTGTPVILREGATTDGPYAWEIQFPMLITYLSASEKIQQDIILTLLISKVPTSESVRALGINSFVVKTSGARYD